MRKHGGTPSRHDRYVTLAAISPPGVARGRFVGGHQSGLAGCKLPPLFQRRACSCSSHGQGQREAWGASPRPSAPTYHTYLPTYLPRQSGHASFWTARMWKPMPVPAMGPAAAITQASHRALGSNAHTILPPLRNRSGAGSVNAPVKLCLAVVTITGPAPARAMAQNMT